MTFKCVGNYKPGSLLQAGWSNGVSYSYDINSTLMDTFMNISFKCNIFRCTVERFSEDASNHCLPHGVLLAKWVYMMVSVIIDMTLWVTICADSKV